MNPKRRHTAWVLLLACCVAVGASIVVAAAYAPPAQARFWTTLLLACAALAVLGTAIGYRWRRQQVRFYRKELKATEALQSVQARLNIERKYRAILDQAFEFIGVITPDGTLTEANRAALEIAGVKESDVLGKPFWETPWWTHSPDLQNRLREAIKAAAGGEFVRFEATHPAVADGSLHSIDFSLKPVKDETGKVAFLIPEGRDVTDRKRAEEAASRAREWERTFDAVPSLIALIDTDCRIILANQNMAQRLGYTPQQLIGKDCSEVIYGTSELPDFSPPKKTMVSGKEECAELAIDHLNGFFEVRATPLHDDSGRLVGCVHVVRDITAKKQAEEALLRSEEQYRRLFSEARDGVCLADATTGEILDCNQALLDLVDRTQEELIGQPQVILHPPANDGNPLSPDFRQFVGSAPGTIIETQVVRRNGETRMVEVKGSTFNVRGRTVAQGVFRDVTERKRAEEQLLETNRHLEEATARANKLAAEAQEANQAKSRFLANASHELRTPLNAVIGFSEGLLERTDVHPLNEHQKDRLAKIKTSGEHLLHLINEILDVSRAESGKLETMITNFAVEPVVWEVADIVEALLKSKPDVRFRLDMPDFLPAMTSDRGKLRQILINLLGNAVKYTHCGYVGLQIRLAYDSLVFSVQDTGIGVASEHLNSLFDPFYQAKRGPHSSMSGTGLGLSISKSLASLLGGTLTVESTLGQGSTFTLTVPLVKRHDSPETPHDDHNFTSLETPQEAAPC
jgi:PAS domain S-box-containing protein